MKRISKTATIGSIAILSAAIVAGAISTNVNVRDTSDEKVYFESDSSLSTDVSFERLAKLSYDEYHSYTAVQERYFGASDVLVDMKSYVDATEDDVVSEAADEKVVAEDLTEKNEEKTENVKKEEAPKKASKYDKMAISTGEPFVNIRESADTDAEVVGKLYRNSIGTISEENGDWLKITSGNVTGYVMRQFVASGENAQKLYPQCVTQIATVTTNMLRVRKEGSINADVIDVVSAGDRYTVLSNENGWTKIDVKGQIGYLSSDYLTFEDTFETAISLEEEAAAAQAAKLAEEEALRKEAAQKAAQEAAQKAAQEAAQKAAQQAAAQQAAAQQAAQQAAAQQAAAQQAAQNQNVTSNQTTTVNTGAMSYTDEDIKLLTCIVYTEVGSEPYATQLAVANVVLNRVKSSIYPNTISGVIYQPYQFGPARAGTLARQLQRYTASGSCYMAAKAALEGNNNIGSRIAFNTVSDSPSHSNDVIMGVVRFW